MGIPGLFKLVKSKDVAMTQYNSLEELASKNPSELILIDFFAIFYWFIYYTCRFIRKNIKNQEFLKSFFAKLFSGIKNLIVVFDGGRSINKHQTSLKRLETMEKAAEKAQTYLKEGSRLGKSKWKKLLKCMVAAAPIPDETIIDLKNFLSGKGITVETAEYEADVWIAKKTQITSSIAVSTDSDFFIHCSKFGNCHFKSFQKSFHVSVVHRDAILSKMHLSLDQLEVLAVVSRNDYCRNAYGYGLIKNLKMVFLILILDKTL